MGRKKGIHITASHISGDKNIEADRESRKLFVDLEWMLYFKSLSKAVMLLNYTANVDLLSSNANHQFHTCYSCNPDPEASGANSLIAGWSSLIFYVFPPFSIIWRKVLKKIKAENADVCRECISWLYHFGQTNHGFLLYSKSWPMHQFYLLLGNICCTYPDIHRHCTPFGGR